MTLTDILEPSLIVLSHAEVKGLEIGAGLGLAVCAPLLSLKPSAVNARDDPPLVALARCAATGAIVGGALVGGGCLLKMCRLDAAGIRERADKLRANVEQRQLDTVAVAGAGVGVGLAALRFAKVGEQAGKSWGEAAQCRQSAWETFGFAMMGAAVAVGGVTVGKMAWRKVREARQGGESGVETEVADTVEKAVTEAAAATEEKEKDVEVRAKEIVEEVKSAVQPPKQ